MGMYFTAFPDAHLTIEDMLAEGDRVLTRWTGSGTHRGDFMGIAPTGTSITVDGMLVSRCKEGKVVEEHEILDTLGLLQQLGAIPAQAAAATA